MSGNLIVMSVDAMVYEDLAFLATLPHFGRLLREGSVARRVNTIYPSLTHPVHASLITGCPAGRTGIAANTAFAPGDPDPVWHNRLDELRCDTLLHAARRAGLVTAACRWPMTAGGFDVIDFLVPEVMDREIRETPDPEALYRRVCSPALFEDVVRPRLPLLDAPERHPAYEEFSMACAAEILRRHKPNLLLTHPGMVDHCRHRHGLFAPEVTEALRMTDRWLGMLLEAVEDAGMAGETSFAVVSDHGQLETVRTAAPNVLFVREGLIRLDCRGGVADWDACAAECGLSCQVYVKDPAREPEVYRRLLAWRDAGLYGFEAVLTRAECAARYGLDGDFSFVLEGDGCTAFTGDWTGDYMRPDPDAGCGARHGGHGHMPHRGPQPPMVLWGPAFRSGVTLERADLLDEAPTFAAALGLAIEGASGSPIRELLAGR